jgi:hypothetical protein
VPSLSSVRPPGAASTGWGRTDERPASLPGGPGIVAPGAVLARVLTPAGPGVASRGDGGGPLGVPRPGREAGGGRAPDRRPGF